MAGGGSYVRGTSSLWIPPLNKMSISALRLIHTVRFFSYCDCDLFLLIMGQIEVCTVMLSQSNSLNTSIDSCTTHALR